MNVLIADDDPVIIRLLSMALRKAGFATFVAYDVVQAMATIRRSKIDAVVLDLSMPGGSGHDVVHRLKSSNRTGQIPIIVVSGSAGAEQKAQVLADGADLFLEKPPDLAALLAGVAKLTGGQPAGAGTVRPFASNVAVLVGPEYHGA